MKIARAVTNEEFNQAYADKDNINIIRAVCSKYRKQLTEDELRSCGMIALWQTLASHRPEYNTKFTSSLWRWLHWECCREIDGHKKTRKEYSDVNLCFFKNDSVEKRAYVVDCLSKLPKDDRKIIKQRFLLNMTFEDIGKANRFSKEKARQRFLCSIQKLKEVCLTHGV